MKAGVGGAGLAVATLSLVMFFLRIAAESSSSSSGPSQVHLGLTPQDDEMVVWWVTKDLTGPSTVQYGLSKDKLDMTEIVRDDPFYIQEPRKLRRYRSDWMHEVGRSGNPAQRDLTVSCWCTLAYVMTPSPRKPAQLILPENVCASEQLR